MQNPPKNIVISFTLRSTFEFRLPSLPPLLSQGIRHTRTYFFLVDLHIKNYISAFSYNFLIPLRSVLI